MEPRTVPTKRPDETQDAFVIRIRDDEAEAIVEIVKELEPFSGQDPVLGHAYVEIIEEIRKRIAARAKG